MLEAGEQTTLGGGPQSPPAPAGAPLDAAEHQRALRADLERRIAELAATPDEAFGRLSAVDAAVVLALFVFLPALAVWLWR